LPKRLTFQILLTKAQLQLANSQTMELQLAMMVETSIHARTIYWHACGGRYFISRNL